PTRPVVAGAARGGPRDGGGDAVEAGLHAADGEGPRRERGVLRRKNLPQSRKGAKEEAKKTDPLCFFLCAFATLREILLPFTASATPSCSRCPGRCRPPRP